MAGDSGKEKFITPPKDVLEPLDAPENSFVEAESAFVRNRLRILEDETGCLYINPDAQHVGSMHDTLDILRIYSREIQALRKIVTLLMGITTRQQEIMDGKTVNGAPRDIYVKVDKYLQNASWELTLLVDPRLPRTHPD